MRWLRQFVGYSFLSLMIYRAIKSTMVALSNPCLACSNPGKSWSCRNQDKRLNFDRQHPKVARSLPHSKHVKSTVGYGWISALKLVFDPPLRLKNQETTLLSAQSNGEVHPISAENCSLSTLWDQTGVWTLMTRRDLFEIANPHRCCSLLVNISPQRQYGLQSA